MPPGGQEFKSVAPCWESKSGLGGQRLGEGKQPVVEEAEGRANRSGAGQGKPRGKERRRARVRAGLKH
jgi:hypothetical protein